MTKLKIFLMELLNKSVLMSKTKQRLASLKQMQPFISQIGEQEFKENLFPVINKSLLRSPEIALSVVSVILSSLMFDLSSFSADLGPTFCSNLKSKDDATREDAVEAVKALAIKSSDAAAIEKLIETIFDILGGSGGKISLNSVKVSLLTAAGGLASTSLGSASQTSLAVSATKKFVKYLKDESHEATLISGVEQLSQWTGHYSITIPDDLMSAVSRVVVDKNQTSGVRTAWLMCLSSALTSSTAGSAAALISPLTRVVETSGAAAGQSVGEAVIAARCLVTIASADPGADISSLLTMITDTDKCLFYQDRFLSSAPASALSSLSSLASSLITHHVDKVTNIKMIYKCLAQCLVSPSSSVRSQVVQDMSGLAKTLGGVSDVVRVLEQLVSIMSVKQVTRDRVDSGQGGEIGASDSVVVTSVLSSVSGLVSSVPWSQEDSGRIVLALAPVLHHPVVLSADSDIWRRTCNKLKLTPSQVIQENSETVLTMVEEMIENNNSVGQEMVKMIVKHCPALMIEKILTKTRNSLSSSELLSVSVEEFMIYQTAEGELFDKAVVENAKSDGPSHNMKRENKAYSYKEQLEEQKLRKELEAKRAKEGKLKAPELTPKQKEVMKLTLAKESETRARVRVLAENSKPCLDMLQSVVESRDASNLAPHVHKFLPILYRAVSSPLVAERVTGILYRLKYY